MRFAGVFTASVLEGLKLGVLHECELDVGVVPLAEFGGQDSSLGSALLCQDPNPGLCLWQNLEAEKEVAVAAARDAGMAEVRKATADVQSSLEVCTF
jgi:hypothetical protein